MRNPSALRRDARRVYETARFFAALRIGIVVVPVSLIAAMEDGAFTRTISLGLVLWSTTILLRWRMDHGFLIVERGLQCGAVPLAAALAVCRFAPYSPPAIALALCGGAGIVGGAILGRSLSAFAPWKQWCAAVLVGALMATMGCLALGVMSAVGATIGIGIGTAMAFASLALPKT